MRFGLLSPFKQCNTSSKYVLLEMTLLIIPCHHPWTLHGPTLMASNKVRPIHLKLLFLSITICYKHKQRQMRAEQARQAKVDTENSLQTSDQLIGKIMDAQPR